MAVMSLKSLTGNRTVQGVLIFLAVSSSLTLVPSADRGEGNAPFYQSAGTKKMAALLVKIYQEQDWRTDPNKDGERAEHYKQMLEAESDLGNELKIRQVLAEFQLRAGDSAGAIEQLERIRNLSAERGVVLPSSLEKGVRDSL